MSKEMKYTQQLRPCPFCGADYHSLYFITTEDYSRVAHMYTETIGIFCNNCKQTVTLGENETAGDTHETRMRAIVAWNRRYS